MNHKTLKDSAHNLESLDAGTVQDLIEMTKRFPYFAWPFVLLAKQYQQKQDFRAEALMHQAALRVHDRSWLYTFSHASKPAIAHAVPQPSEPKINIQTPVIEPTVNVEAARTTPAEPPALLETEIQIPILEPTVNVEAAITTPAEPPASLETETPTPFVEPAVLLEAETPTPVEALSERSTTETPTPVTEPTVKVEAEIPTPFVEPAVLLEAETPMPTTPLPVASAFVSDPKRIQSKNERQPLFTPERVQFYDLERIFSEKQPVEQEPHKGMASTDFYAWLNTAPPKATSPDVIATEPTPVAHASEIPESIAQQKSIIENFLINKPSISRPKQEFFKPEKAQKKGEILSGAIVTETLARIYLKQDNPQKAIWAYQQLQLKFPEKKTYFANLISQIEIEQNKL